MTLLNFKSNTRQSAWRMANPERYRAHVSVQRALEKGELQKEPCEVCGNTIVDGHHDDYSKPLAIRWLCRKHHVQHHARERQALQAAEAGQLEMDIGRPLRSVTRNAASRVTSRDKGMGAA